MVGPAWKHITAHDLRMRPAWVRSRRWSRPVKGHHNNTIHQAPFAGSAGPLCGRSRDRDLTAQTRDRELAHAVAKGLECVDGVLMVVTVVDLTCRS